MRTNCALSRNSARSRGADIAHRGAQAAGELVQHGRDRPLVGHLPLDAFRHELQRVAAPPPGSSGRPSRAPWRRPSPCRDRICRSGPGRGRPRPGSRRCRRAASRPWRTAAPAASALARSPENLMPPSAITGMPASRGRLDRVHDGGELRHADAGDDARGADRARPDADLDRVGAGIDQRLGAFARRDVAGDDCTALDSFLTRVDALQHAARNGRARCRRR